jgi:hypothetical protein
MDAKTENLLKQSQARLDLIEQGMKQNRFFLILAIGISVFTVLNLKK